MAIASRSTSPIHSLQQQQQQQQQQEGSRSRTSTASPLQFLKSLTPYDTSEIKILLLENVHQDAVQLLRQQGYQVEHHAKAMSEDQLIEKIKDVHVIGIRSKTQMTKAVIDAATKLMVIGCFCIGTNQVDLQAAAQRGVVVFNSPFSNSRSVAELVIGEVVALARQLIDRGSEMHQGTWKKVSKGCYEIRGKTLGIVGYGHIGSQVSVLAEAMGMSVVFYDIMNLMPLGRAEPLTSLNDVLSKADFVTLHVPETEDTKNMIGAAQLQLMKQGSYLINNARGSVVDLAALKKAIQDGHLAGAAMDVFPKEPSTSPADFVSEMQGLPNVILTPHIGGSTEEAQTAIGMEVGDAIIRYLNEGRSTGAVNFPEVELRVGWDWSGKSLTSPVVEGKGARVLCVHRNVPGVLKRINDILSPFNIAKQICDSKGELAYLMVDVETHSMNDLAGIYKQLEIVDWSIKTRILY